MATQFRYTTHTYKYTHHRMHSPACSWADADAMTCTRLQPIQLTLDTK